MLRQGQEPARRAIQAALLNPGPRMNQSGKNHPKEPPSLGNTLFLAGACIGIGTLALLIGLGAIPAGSAKNSASGNLMAIGVGTLFVFAGLMVLVRDFAGARNNEELPANAPAFLRTSASLLNILLLAVFAAISSFVAFGGLPSLQSGGGAILFRAFLGAFALLLWYGVIYLVLAKLKRGTGRK